MNTGPVLDQYVKHGVVVHADRQRVFDALTTAQGLDCWFTTGATIDARPGGSVVFRWVDWGVDRYSGEDGGPIVELVRPSRFVFQWHTEGGESVTTVAIDLEERGDDTIVRLTETGFSDTPTGRQRLLDNATGWGEALTLMKFHVEHGVRY